MCYHTWKNQKIFSALVEVWERQLISFSAWGPPHYFHVRSFEKAGRKKTLVFFFKFSVKFFQPINSLQLVQALLKLCSELVECFFDFQWCAQCSYEWLELLESQQKLNYLTFPSWKVYLAIFRMDRVEKTAGIVCGTNRFPSQKTNNIVVKQNHQFSFQFAQKRTKYNFVEVLARKCHFCPTPLSNQMLQFTLFKRQHATDVVAVIASENHSECEKSQSGFRPLPTMPSRFSEVL